MFHIPFYNLIHGHGEFERPITLSQPEELANTGITVLGRIMFSSIFLMGGINHLVRYQQMVDYALSNNVPAAGLLVPLTGAMILLGGLSMLLGIYARLGAWLLVMFLVPTAILMHHFWDVEDPAMAAMQMAHFLKNISLAGAALLFTRMGSGTGSLTRD
jgi:putative oxidoreductase